MGSLSLQVPVSGQPNTSEDPKIASDLTTIQTWANGGIDSTNLSATAAIARSQLAGGGGNLIPTSVSANTSATDGHLYLVTAGSVTITLPNPAAGVTVGVFAASNLITGSAPVTVTTPTGDIAGVGVFATSITLGTTNSFVVLLGDGGAWRIVAGQRDTGWVPLTLGASVAATGSGWAPPGVRVLGDTGFLRGSVTTTGALGSGSTLVTLPAVAIPNYTFAFGAVYWNGSSMIPTDLKYAPGGALSSIVALGASSQFFLDGFTYSLA